mmetsp:Transcript_2906/g.5973  ORF Transcript_2906/g.5973 Transcript_2906/m.5973 type:complete len:662 (+) Transcript_2906:113-2098(+)
MGSRFLRRHVVIGLLALCYTSLCILWLLFRYLWQPRAAFKCSFRCSLPPTLIGFSSEEGRRLLIRALSERRDPAEWPELHMAQGNGVVQRVSLGFPNDQSHSPGSEMKQAALQVGEAPLSLRSPSAPANSAYFLLAEHYSTQSEMLNCATGAFSMVFNALRLDPGEFFRSVVAAEIFIGFRYFSERSFDKCVSRVLRVDPGTVYGLTLPPWMSLSQVEGTVGVSFDAAGKILSCQCRDLVEKPRVERRAVEQRGESCDIRMTNLDPQVEGLWGSREGGDSTEWDQARERYEQLVDELRESQWSDSKRIGASRQLLSIAETYCAGRPVAFRSFVGDLLGAVDDPSRRGFVVVSYSRILEILGVGGHYSPVGAAVTDERGRRWALLFDVARYKFEAHWVPLELLFFASGGRGFVFIRRCSLPTEEEDDSLTASLGEVGSALKENSSTIQNFNARVGDKRDLEGLRGSNQAEGSFARVEEPEQNGSHMKERGPALNTKEILTRSPAPQRGHPSSAVTDEDGPVDSPGPNNAAGPFNNRESQGEARSFVGRVRSDSECDRQVSRCRVSSSPSRRDTVASKMRTSGEGVDSIRSLNGPTSTSTSSGALSVSETDASEPKSSNDPLNYDLIHWQGNFKPSSPGVPTVVPVSRKLKTTSVCGSDNFHF